jgi:hypothetical protein
MRLHSRPSHQPLIDRDQRKHIRRNNKRIPTNLWNYKHSNAKSACSNMYGRLALFLSD